MKLRVFAAGSALGMVLCGVASVSAQTSAGTMSVAAVGNWVPTIGGTMHLGGSGRVLGLPVQVDEKKLRIPVHREHSFRFNVNTDSADAERRFRSS